MSETRVTFFQVKSPQEKLGKICLIAEEYFEKKNSLILKVPDQTALKFIDLLLWRHPKESFLPHVTDDTKWDDRIVITTSDENQAGATSIFNLTPDVIKNPFTHIYEFEDLSSQSKSQIAKDHYQAYKSAGHQIIQLNLSL